MMDIKEDDIGATLKARRQKLGHSLDDAARYTRIRKTYLESLENNRFSDLPGHAYVTGFMRVYAQFLQLDAASLLARLDPTAEAPFPSLQSPTAAKYHAAAIVKPAGNTGWSAFAVGFVVVLLIGAAIYFLPAYFSAVEEQPAPQVTSPVTDEEPVEEKPVEVESAAATADDAALATEPVPETPSPVVTESTAVDVDRDLPAIGSEGSQLRMLALTESSLILYLDERKAHRYKLHEGLDLTWKIKNKVVVEMDEPGIARFWLDGEEIRLDGLEQFRLQQDPGD